MANDRGGWEEQFDRKIDALLKMVADHIVPLAGSVDRLEKSNANLEDAIKKLTTNVIAQTNVLREHEGDLISMKTGLTQVKRWGFVLVAPLVLLAAWGSFRLGTVETTMDRLDSRVKQIERIPNPPEQPPSPEVVPSPPPAALKRQPVPAKSSAPSSFDAVLLVTNPVTRKGGGKACIVAVVENRSGNLNLYQVTFADSANGTVANMVRERASETPGSQSLVQGQAWIHKFGVHVPDNINQSASFVLTNWTTEANSRLRDDLHTKQGLIVSSRTAKLPRPFTNLNGLSQVFAALTEQSDLLKTQ